MSYVWRNIMELTIEMKMIVHLSDLELLRKHGLL